MSLLRMTITSRTFQTEKYRFAFNGQQRDTEIDAQIYHAEHWKYDARTARRWNKDPVFVPFESPYATFRGNPILFNDPNGDIPILPIIGRMAIGGLVGGSSELVAQFLFNYIKEKDVTKAWSAVDIADIGTATIEGAMTGGYAKFAKAARITCTVATIAASQFIQSSVDLLNFQDGFVIANNKEGTTKSIDKAKFDTTLGAGVALTIYLASEFASLIVPRRLVDMAQKGIDNVIEDLASNSRKISSKGSKRITVTEAGEYYGRVAPGLRQAHAKLANKQRLAKLHSIFKYVTDDVRDFGTYMGSVAFAGAAGTVTKGFQDLKPGVKESYGAVNYNVTENIYQGGWYVKHENGEESYYTVTTSSAQGLTDWLAEKGKKYGGTADVYQD